MRMLSTVSPGHIGSHRLRALRRSGVGAVAFDDLAEARADAAPSGRPTHRDVHPGVDAPIALRADPRRTPGRSRVPRDLAAANPDGCATARRAAA